MAPPAPTSALTRLVRLDDGHPALVARRLLVLACELLDMDTGFVGVLDRTADPVTRTVVVAVTRDGSDVPEAIGLTEPLAQTWCAGVVAEGALLVKDARGHAELASLPATSAFGIVSHAGVVVSSPETGAPLGTFCLLGHASHASLNAKLRRPGRPLQGLSRGTISTPARSHM